MDLSKLKPEYEARVYQISVKFPPFTFGTERVVGYYEDKGLAHRVWSVFHEHFMSRINGGVDVFFKEYYVRVEKISGEWCLLDDPGQTIETSFNHEKIQTCIDSLTRFAKGIKIKVIGAGGRESSEGVYIDRQKNTEPPMGEEEKDEEEGAEEKLYALGFARFETKKELEKAYKKWSLANHPDKQPGDQRSVADARFRVMKTHYYAVLEARGWAQESTHDDCS